MIIYGGPIYIRPLVWMDGLTSIARLAKFYRKVTLDFPKYT